MSAKIIVFGSYKGGVGKTTNSVAVAAELGRRGHKVQVVDFDIQGNATVMITRAPSKETGMPVEVQNLSSVARNNPKGLGTLLREQAKACDYLVIDTPGNIESDGTQVAFVIADLIVIPLRPSPHDLGSTQETLGLLARVQLINEKVQIRLLKVTPERTIINNAVEDEIDKLDAPVLQTVIRKSVGFLESAATGLPLWSIGRSGANADKDIRALTDELLAVVAQEAVAA